MTAELSAAAGRGILPSKMGGGEPPDAGAALFAHALRSEEVGYLREARAAYVRYCAAVVGDQSRAIERIKLIDRNRSIWHRKEATAARQRIARAAIRPLLGIALLVAAYVFRFELAAVAHASVIALSEARRGFPPVDLGKVGAATVGILAVASWVTFREVHRLGHASQERIRAQFNQAINSGVHVVKIGSVRWVPVSGQFFHLGGDGKDRGRLYIGDTGWNERRTAEITGVIERRNRFHLVTAATVLVALVAFFVGGDTPYLPPLGLIALAVLLSREIFYRFGDQTFEGSMVLDPAPGTFDQAAVRAQMAHGDARLSTQEEVQRASQTDSSATPIASQKF